MRAQAENARLYAIIDRLNVRGSDGGSEETGSQASDLSAYGAREVRAAPEQAACCYVLVWHFCQQSAVTLLLFLSIEEAIRGNAMLLHCDASFSCFSLLLFLWVM